MIDLAKKALAIPSLFDGYQWLVGSPRCHKRIMSEMVQPGTGERVLDIGCGVGESVRHLSPSVRYVGIDISERYITRAKKDYGDRGQFFCMDASSADANSLGIFDRAFAFGVLHHISDDAANGIVDLVRRVVRPGGVFVTIDPCHVPGEHPIAKFFIKHDRGRYVRDVEGFRRLVLSLGTIRSQVFHDLLRIPFTQIVMVVQLNPSSLS